MTDLEKINIQQRHITDLEAELVKATLYNNKVRAAHNDLEAKLAQTQRCHFEWEKLRTARIADLEAKLAKSEGALTDIRKLILDDEAQDPYFTTECFLEHLEDYKHAYEKLSRIEEIEAKLAKSEGEAAAMREAVELNCSSSVCRMGCEIAFKSTAGTALLRELEAGRKVVEAARLYLHSRPIGSDWNLEAKFKAYDAATKTKEEKKK